MIRTHENTRTPRALRVLQDFWQEIGHKKSYLIPLLFISVLSYAYSVTHETLSIDDLRRDYYQGGQAEKLSGRWGTIVWTRLAASGKHAAFIDKYFSAVFLLLAVICFAALLHRIGKTKVWAYTVFSCAFVSYPLINEIWEYTVTNFQIFGNLFFCGVILLHLYEHDGRELLSCLRDKTQSSSAKAQGVLRVYLMPVLLMALMASSYESGVTFYITAVMVVLFYRYCVVQDKRPEEETPWQWVFHGIHFAVPVVAGIVMSSVIGRIIRFVLHLQSWEAGDNSIRWGETTAWGLFKLVLTEYVAKGLIYHPIAVFVVLTAVFGVYCIIRSVRTRRVLPLLLGFLTGLSLFLLTMVQGSVQPYRASQCFMIYVAFVLFLVARIAMEQSNNCDHPDGRDCERSLRTGHSTENVHSDKCDYPDERDCERSLRTERRTDITLSRFHTYAGVATVAICLLICLQMASFMNWIFYLNHQRSENESALAYSIGYKLMNEYPHGKRICFVGWGTSGDYIEQLLRTSPQSKKGNLYIRVYRRLWKEDPVNLRGPETNVNSVITWLKGTPEMLYQYFAYHGYNLNIVPWTEQDVHQEAIQIAKELGLQSYEISEQEDYIIVCLPWLDF